LSVWALGFQKEASVCLCKHHQRVVSW